MVPAEVVFEMMREVRGMTCDPPGQVRSQRRIRGETRSKSDVSEAQGCGIRMPGDGVPAMVVGAAPGGKQIRREVLAAAGREFQHRAQVVEIEPPEWRRVRSDPHGISSRCSGLANEVEDPRGNLLDPTA